MKLISPNRMKLGALTQGRSDVVHDSVEFLSITELALLGPTLLFCVVLAQIWPLYLMAGIQILGSILGVLKFNHPTDQFQSCVPLTSTVREGVGPRPVNWKKAA